MIIDGRKTWTDLQSIHARLGFPAIFSAGWKNASRSLVLSLIETVGASGLPVDCSFSDTGSACAFTIGSLGSLGLSTENFRIRIKV